MVKAEVFSKTGVKSAQSAELPADIFGVQIKNTVLMNQAYRAYLANGRSVNAKTLTRGLVRGGGKKPWRQKGTGRARFGSSRVPIWRGGGITFGPTGNENFTIKLPLKAKRLAIRQALSTKADSGAVKIIETFDCPNGTVKPTIELLKKMQASGKVLLVVSLKDQLVDRATRNISDLKAVQAKYLNTFDIINADHILISRKSLEVIENWLGKTTAKFKVEKAELGVKT